MSKRKRLPNSESPDRAVAWVSLGQIRRNFESLAGIWKASREGRRALVAMLKCDAYGHGANEVARSLQGLSGLHGFGVATIEEGLSLRRGGCRLPIWVFSGAGRWSADRHALFARERLTPVFFEKQDLSMFLGLAARGADLLPFHLKWNTGMNRLGFSPDEASEIRRMCQRARVLPEGQCTHLASADQMRTQVTVTQLMTFREILAEFGSAEIAHIHCANTSGIFRAGEARVDAWSNVARPGIGLFGYVDSEPLRARAKKEGIHPALSLSALVLQRRELRRGDVVGYGGAYKSLRNEPESVFALGYGDGFPRQASGTVIDVGLGGAAPRAGSIHWTRAQVMGRVSMDLVSLKCRARPGEVGWFLSTRNANQGYKLADAAGTIIYEVLTGLSSRVSRVYVE